MPRITELSPEELLGDLCAPEGSRLWCIGMKREIQKLLDQHKTDHAALQTCVEAFVEREGWRQLRDKGDRPFMGFTDFCLARRPFGLQRSEEEIKQIIAESRKTAEQHAANPKTLPEPGEVGKGRGGVRDKKLISKGPTADYLTARIARDRPDVLERMKAGEFKSVRQAGIVAGIVKIPTPLDLLRRAWAKASKAEREAFVEWIGRDGGEL